jgi:preprotein translocase subunit YajC
MYFFYFSIINMFFFFLIERRKEEQEKPMLEMLHVTGPPDRVSHFRSEETDHDRTDG